MPSETIKLNQDAKTDIIRSIQNFFLSERDEEISEFQASIFLDFILNEVGIYIYNQAISDAHELTTLKLEEIFSLEKRISNSKSKFFFESHT